MQVLLGLSDVGEILHTEFVPILRPIQLIALARARLSEFAQVEVWQEAVCILRCPPLPLGGARF
jgi:hypothetical protein